MVGEETEKGTRSKSECCKFLIQIDSNYDKNVVRAGLAACRTFINQALSFEREFWMMIKVFLSQEHNVHLYIVTTRPPPGDRG